ncbi:SPOR domain-containing protein [Advenella mimigardefordensis]|uniref:Sporulation domain-containing protein n=1 Tax=Advenella mimigardefordensis (strain DSM 17166 / LMG 22922 / DPN7) TaxID=1247726 RepID=W0PAX0_ADVMD|nr:SPOR domain-containing protein [Advenella mimigardefordensis]AHG64004.1 sporulation domain-containing protein [Advenella mimigardefordensis DPN7]
MGLFNSQDDNRPGQRRTQSEQNQANDLRVKARNRLIGAIILVLAAVIIVPMVLDTGGSDNTPTPAQKPPLVSGGGSDSNSLSVTTTPGVESNGPSSTSQQATVDGSAPQTPPVSGSVASGTAEPPQTPETTPATQDPGLTGLTEAIDPNRSIASGTANQPVTPEDQAARQKQEAEAAAKAQADAKRAAERKKAAASKPAEPPKKPGVIRDDNRTDDGSRALAILEGREPAPAEKSKPKVTSGDYSLQIASYGSSDDAQSRRSKLAADGVSNAYVQNSVVNGKQIYRLRVGPFKSREAAQAAQTRLRSLGYDNGFISSN